MFEGNVSIVTEYIEKINKNTKLFILLIYIYTVYFN